MCFFFRVQNSCIGCRLVLQLLSVNDFSWDSPLTSYQCVNVFNIPVTTGKNNNCFELATYPNTNLVNVDKVAALTYSVLPGIRFSMLGLASLHANVSPNKSFLFFFPSPGPKCCNRHATFSRAGTRLWRYVSVTLLVSSSGMLLHLHQCVRTKGSSRPLHKGTSASLFISEIKYPLDVQICAYWVEVFIVKCWVYVFF